MGGEQGAGAREKGRALRGRPDEAWRAVQQPAAEPGLQRLQPGADGRLHRAGRFGRAGEVAEFQGEHEEADGFQIEHDRGIL